MARLSSLAALLALVTLALPSAAEPTRKAPNQVVRMDPIKARRMKPQATIEVAKRRMTLRPRAVERLGRRIGSRLDRAPF
ncbi:MAG: hypothetical protein KC731_41345 [Myxococcales bacterium]|nr:hypothetical protein [Myxococcales bacterium]